MKATILALAVVALCACSSAPPRTAVLSVVSDPADELECVGKCLEYGDETCETCVDRCMDSPPSAAVAITRGAPLDVPAPR